MFKTQNFSLKLIVFSITFTALFTMGILNVYAQEETDELDAKIKRGEKLIGELNEKLEGTPDDNPGKQDARKLFNDARDAVNAVHPELASGNRDKALENATNAVNLALNAINKIDDTATEQLINQDENITPQDLGVGEPRILPGNPLYAFKGLIRGIQSFTTFNPAEKAELKLKFANEKLVEAKKLEEDGNSDDRVKLAVENYEEEVQRVKIEIEKLGNFTDKAAIEQIVKKTVDAQIKHHKALGKVMKKRDDIAPEIEAKKAAAMKHFSEGMANTVEPEVMRQKFEEAIKEQRGSAFRHFKHIEVLEEVKDFVPEQARDAMQNAIENSSKFFEEEFSQIEERERKLFNKYIEKLGGNEVRHLEAFDSINAFAVIEEEMFEEMEKARENARRKIEKRMNEIEDETRKQVFISHLEEGKMEDARIVNELENNLGPETIGTILDIKHKMDQRMREQFENAQSAGDLNSFFDEIDSTHDVRMMEVLNEMGEIIPEDKKEFWEEMKVKAMTEMNDDIAEARRFGRFEDELRSLAGFDPEQIDIIDDFEGEFGGQFGFFEDIKREQAELVQGRFENFREFTEKNEGDEDFEDFFGKAEEFRLRIQNDPRVFEQIEQFAPGIQGDFENFDRSSQGFGFDIERVDRVMADAERAISELTSKIASADSEHPGLEAARGLLKEAGSHLEDARSALAVDDAGKAFGQATSASHIAHNGLRHLETSAFEFEREQYFEERDEFIEKFRDLPPQERPNPSEFIEFKPIFSPDIRPGFKPDFRPDFPLEEDNRLKEFRKFENREEPTQAIPQPDFPDLRDEFRRLEESEEDEKTTEGEIIIHEPVPVPEEHKEAEQKLIDEDERLFEGIAPPSTFEPSFQLPDFEESFREFESQEFDSTLQQ